MAEPLVSPAGAAVLARNEAIALEIAARDRSRVIGLERTIEEWIAGGSRLAARYRAERNLGAVARVELRRARLVALLTNLRVGPPPEPEDD